MSISVHGQSLIIGEKQIPQCCYCSEQIRILYLNEDVFFVVIISNKLLNIRSLKKISDSSARYIFFHFHFSRVTGSVGPRASLSLDCILLQVEAF